MPKRTAPKLVVPGKDEAGTPRSWSDQLVAPDSFVPEESVMCRNIKTLHNFAPPATDEEIRASSIQFVRKLCGFSKPSKANEAAFSRAVDQVTAAARELLDSLVTNAPPRDRAVEAAKAHARGLQRFQPALKTA